MIPVAMLAAGTMAGAIAGSFLGTIILRWPEGRGVVKGRSACDSCGHTLGLRDLVPLLSALIQRGKCRICGSAIDPLHGWMEAGCALIGALALGAMPDVGGVGWALLGWMLLTLAVLDWRHFWLPDALTFSLVFGGLTIGLWATDVALSDRVIGAVAGYGALLAVATGYRALRGREGLGLGDAKLLGALGAWFGWQALPFILLLGALLGVLLVAVAAIGGRSASATTRVPLGTFLAIGSVPGWVMMLALTGRLSGY